MKKNAQKVFCFLVAIGILLAVVVPKVEILISKAEVDAFPKTVYFYTTGNGNFNDWTKTCDIYIYLIGGADTSPQIMTKSSKQHTLLTDPDAVLWEYTIEDENCTGIIFVNKDSWGEEFYQTVDISLSDGQWSSYVSPCFALDGGYEGSGKKTVNCIGDLKPQSHAGETMYFMDMSGVLSTGTMVVTAVFSAEGLETQECVMHLENGIYEVEIPEDVQLSQDTTKMPYSTVSFQDSVGNQLGEAYNFLNEPTGAEVGVEFDPDTKNTFYYRATEIAGMKLHKWGQYPGLQSVEGMTLYLSEIIFSTDQAYSIQVGDAETVTLTSDGEVYSYTIPEDTGDSQSTVISITTPDSSVFRFVWDDLTSNLLVLNEDFAIVSGTYDSDEYYVFFDATLSKLSYSGSVTSDATMPISGGQIYYHAWNNDEDYSDGTMEKMVSFTKGKNTWSEVYKATLDKEYAYIIFYSSLSQGIWPAETALASRTGDLTIPQDLKNPCFYADTSDSSIYDNSHREGYWGEIYTIRDAEQYKTAKDVVDIKPGTLVRGENIFYVNSTFYDYYSDYELNGENRDTYGGVNLVSQRNWVNFRQFDQALSDYYKKGNVALPLYTGHFQAPVYANDKYRFADIADTLGLYGYNDSNLNRFFAINNSEIDISGNMNKYDYASNGLVFNQLVDGKIMATGSGTVALPYFSEAFLKGENSKNAVLGEVYHDVEFPFWERTIDGVTYWYFDSAETTLVMREDAGTAGYYLQNVDHADWSKNVNSTGTTTGDSVSTTYGFFPFNEGTTGTSGKNYNYGFGSKLEFSFRLTEDGYVLNSGGEKVAITFEFTGDDDVWVFIDDKLVLDVGGDHGRVTGTLNFATKKATVSSVKKILDSDTEAVPKITDFEMSGGNTEEHRLTMFYMERGMWESNMRIQFNFVDQNELEVEKDVDTTDVNELFEELFLEPSLFSFSVKNLATHFGTKEVETNGNAKVPIIYNSVFALDKLALGSSANTFEHLDSWEGQTDVVHWYAKESDTTGAYRKLRYGTILPESGDAVDITNMDYLTFKLYYDYNDTPTLSHMYMQLVDTNGNVKGNVKITDYLSGKSYGSVSLNKKTWCNLKIDLSKLEEEIGFNSQVSKINFGYNYPRDIYLDDFIFYPATVDASQVGFVVEQYAIPDYGSATSGQLEIPVGAKYTSSKGGTYVIGEDGNFVLGDGESVVFQEQFRRGSYIYLEEQVDDELYDTVWTMYESGKAVTSMSAGNSVINGSVTSLSGVDSLIVHDDRTEAYLTGTDDGQTIQNAYNGTKPTEDTFVFRSYSDPDEATISTKLKILYYNKVNTGELTIKKEKAYARDELTEAYVVQITFSNVGGNALENEPITTTVSLNVGEEQTITGIPLGTEYTLKEIPPSDGSELERAEVSSGGSFDQETKVVAGVVNTEHADVTVTLYNTKKPVVEVSLLKEWKQFDGTELTENLPSSISVQLKRRPKAEQGEEEAAYEVVEGYENLTVSLPQDTTWKDYICTISNLDKLVNYKETDSKEYEYCFVELDKEGNVVENNGFTGNYKVTYRQDGVPDGEGNSQFTITNTLYDKTNLKLIKKDKATGSLLTGVVFKLERLTQEGEIDNTFTPIELTTDSNGSHTLLNLQDGQYQLTEIEAADGYSLLKKPILIVLNRVDGCTINEQDYVVDASNTITVEIYNSQKFQLPFTGGYGRLFMMIGGLALMEMVLLMYIFRNTVFSHFKK